PARPPIRTKKQANRAPSHWPAACYVEWRIIMECIVPTLATAAINSNTGQNRVQTGTSAPRKDDGFADALAATGANTQIAHKTKAGPASHRDHADGTAHKDQPIKDSPAQDARGQQNNETTETATRRRDRTVRADMAK